MPGHSTPEKHNSYVSTKATTGGTLAITPAHDHEAQNAEFPETTKLIAQETKVHFKPR